jgi:hypothetical protein
MENINNKQQNAVGLLIEEAQEWGEYKKTMINNKQLSLIDALCIVKTGWRTEQEKELLDLAYLLIKKHSEVLHLEYQRQCIDEKLTEIKEDDKQ